MSQSHLAEVSKSKIANWNREYDLLSLSLTGKTSDQPRLARMKEIERNIEFERRKNQSHLDMKHSNPKVTFTVHTQLGLNNNPKIDSKAQSFVFKPFALPTAVDPKLQERYNLIDQLLSLLPVSERLKAKQDAFEEYKLEQFLKSGGYGYRPSRCTCPFRH